MADPNDPHLPRPFRVGKLIAFIAVGLAAVAIAFALARAMLKNALPPAP